MLTNAAKMCHWTENFCNVPEGMNLGTPVLLLPFELVEYYKIYNNDGAGGTVTVADERELEDALLEDGDAEALALALKVCRAQSPQRSMQLDKMLAQPRSLTWVSQFAAYSCQMASLRLKPHEVPPREQPKDLEGRGARRGEAAAQDAAARRVEVASHADGCDCRGAGHGPRAALHQVGRRVVQDGEPRPRRARRDPRCTWLRSPAPERARHRHTRRPARWVDGAALADWKLAHRLLSQLICGE